MEVALIGGGIGGLTAALALHHAGINCRVFESSTAYQPLGVGLSLRPHAVKVLAKFGLRPDLLARGVDIKERLYFDWHGRLVFREPCGHAAGRDEPYLGLHRADLHQVLLNAVLERLGPEAVVMGHQCIGFEQNANGVVAHFLTAQNGSKELKVAANILVGCDGLRSAVRRQLFPNEPQPIYSGVTSWRGVVRGEPFLSGTTLVLMGTFERGMIAAYPISSYPDGSQLINLVAVLPKASPSLGDYDRTGRLEDFIDHFKDWNFGWMNFPERFSQLQTILELPLVDRNPLDQWTFGRITLLGDAAHPMSPRGGNGAVQSIIDAAILAEVLAAESEPNTALEMYEAQRRTATAEIVQANRENPPDTIIGAAELRTKRLPEDHSGELFEQEELKRIADNYKRITGETMQ
jgi:2-polyprenyl-6-methoxyphenol hydroxylase-like FAD-dependent oxidoreductase